MKTFWQFTPWANRLILLAVTAIFTLISLKYITDPIHSAIASGISAGSALGITTIRVGFGGFPLGMAVILLFCLVATRRLLMGLYFVTTIVGVVLLVRAVAVTIDHSAIESRHLLTAEGVLLTLALAGIFIELGRRRYQQQHAV